MDKILKDFGKKLKQFRLTKGLSQEQLSAITDLDRSYISDIERGLRNVSLKNIEVLADALAIPMYQFFLEEGNILERWDIQIADFEKLIMDNPSLRGFVIGYLAETKLKEQISKDSRISGLKKFDDHDRKNKHDLVIMYKNQEFTIEVKSLQTSTVKKKEDESYQGRFQCDASDKRKIMLNSGEEVTTTCLRFGDFDIVAVNLFAFRGKWEFGFALNKDLPASEYAKYPEELRKNLIKSIIPISMPFVEPFVSDIFILLDRLHKERGR
jgi:transcriptional regulator with XRE-family HTH domain